MASLNFTGGGRRGNSSRPRGVRVRACPCRLLIWRYVNPPIHRYMAFATIPFATMTKAMRCCTSCKPRGVTQEEMESAALKTPNFSPQHSAKSLNPQKFHSSEKGEVLQGGLGRTQRDSEVPEGSGRPRAQHARTPAFARYGSAARMSASATFLKSSMPGVPYALSACLELNRWLPRP